MSEEKIEALIAASETAAWSRHEFALPVSYRSSYTRRAHRAGFEAGLEFARLALSLESELARNESGSTDTDHTNGGKDGD